MIVRIVTLTLSCLLVAQLMGCHYYIRATPEIVITSEPIGPVATDMTPDGP